jgi:flagellar operon protein
MTTLPITPGTPLAAPSTQPAGSASRSSRLSVIDQNAFRRELDSRIQPKSLTFSRHAQKRLEMRGISFTPDGLSRIESAIDRAQEKGSRDALVIAGNLALVVGVNDRTVVTVMNREQMEESVVTNIDSAVFA